MVDLGIPSAPPAPLHPRRKTKQLMVGNITGFTGYNLISYNGDMTTNFLGIAGGATGDDSLYCDATVFYFRSVNAAFNYMSVNSGGVNLHGRSCTNGSFVGNGAGLTNLNTGVIFTPAQVGYAASNNIIITTNNQYFNFTNATSTLYAPNPALVASNQNCTLLVSIEKGTNSLTLSSYGSITNGLGSVNSITVTNSGMTVLLLHRPIYMTNTTANVWGWLKLL
jgi:hypothetical protein